jgi:PAB-dependent poly(A)-specific ribonuclease subunit 2
MNVIEKIGYAPKPVNIKKCQLPYIIPNEFEDDSYDSQIEKSSEGATPRKYRPVEMTFAHLPSEDRQSEIQKYNSTKFVGLEPHIPNTYCNNMLQVAPLTICSS